MNYFDHSREIALFIDKLRFNRNIPYEVFLDSIVSIRQYKRYTSGISSMPYAILEKLSTRLGFRADHVIMELETEKIKQTQTITNLYNAVINNQQNKVKTYLGNISADHLLTRSNELLYTHALNLNEYTLKRCNEITTIEKTKLLINYDVLIKKKVLSTAELLILTSLLQFEAFSDRTKIAETLMLYMAKQVTVVTSHNVRTFVLVLESLAKYYGYSDDYEKIIDCANKAIEYSLSLRSFYLLDRLYYYLSYGYHGLNKFDLRDKYIYKCLYMIDIEENPAKKQMYYNIFKKRFNLDIETIKKNIPEL